MSILACLSHILYRFASSDLLGVCLVDEVGAIFFFFSFFFLAAINL